MMSTLDTSLFYTASNTVKNLLPEKIKKRKNEVDLIKLFLILFAIIAILSSFYIKGFVEFTIAIFPIIGITAFPLFFGVFTKLPDKLVAIAMLIGLASFFYLFFFPPENQLWNMFPALSTGFVIILLAVHKYLKRHNPAIINTEN